MAIINTDTASAAKKPALIVQCDVELEVAFIVFTLHLVEHYALANEAVSKD